VCLAGVRWSGSLVFTSMIDASIHEEDRHRK
jgi:hypothetical protein